MAISPADLDSIDIASQELYERGVPHEEFRLLRAHDPVHWHPWDWKGGGFWALTKHADVVAVSRDAETFSSAAGHIYLWDLEPDALEARRSLIETDGPSHARLRRIVSSAFTPKKVRDYEAYTREIAQELLDRVVAQGEFDWVEGIAAPLPINVIVSILGIPDDDAQMMIDLSNHLAEGTSDIPLDPSAYGNTTPLRLLPFNSPASYALFEYGRKIGEERRRNPTDDLVSRLVHAEVDGDRLTDAEYTNFFQLMVFAGNETTRTAISQGMLALMEHPGEFERIFEEQEHRAHGGRGAHPLGLAGHVLPQDGDARHRDSRRPHRGGRQGGHVVRVRELRRGGLRRPVPARSRPRAERRALLRRRRASLLPRCVPGQARAPHPPRGDPGAECALRAERRAEAASLQLRERHRIDAGACRSPLGLRRKD